MAEYTKPTILLSAPAGRAKTYDNNHSEAGGCMCRTGSSKSEPGDKQDARRVESTSRDK